MNAPLHVDISDRRSFSLTGIRAAIQRLDDRIAHERESWPERYPMPELLDFVIGYREQLVALCRDGKLARCAEVCNASD